MSRTAVLAWDWREQPDLDELARILRDLSGNRVHLHQVDTGSDEYVIVLATEPLNDAAVQDAFRRSWEDGDVPPG